MTREQEIERNMKALGLTKAEAEELYDFDHSDSTTPEIQAMEAGAKKIKRYEKSDKPRKPAPRKIDPTKKRLIGDFRVLLEGLGANIREVKNEAEISFTFDSGEYTVKLIKHRPPK